MTGAEQVEVRTTGTGGICTRTHRADKVPTEVGVLRRSGKFTKIEIRAVGAVEWVTV